MTPSALTIQERHMIHSTVETAILLHVVLLEEENDALRAFAQAVMGYWPDGAPDGGDLQELAEKHGLLKPETRHEPCGEVCACNEYADPDQWAGGMECYRRTALLKGSNAGIHRAAEGRPVE